VHALLEQSLDAVYRRIELGTASCLVGEGPPALSQFAFVLQVIETEGFESE